MYTHIEARSQCWVSTSIFSISFLRQGLLLKVSITNKLDWPHNEYLVSASLHLPTLGFL